MGIKEKPYKIVSRNKSQKEWLVGRLNRDYILKYSIPGEDKIYEELITAGFSFRGVVDPSEEYFIIEKTASGPSYIPLSMIDLFERHVEETVITETVISDVPVPNPK